MTSAPSILAANTHRPWPLPDRPWAMRMVWHDLAFLHWRVPAAAIAERLPAGLEVDTFDGEAWLGVVPFRMTGVTPRFVPALPGLSAFPEINLRTYVRHRDRPGVWFFSLDVTDLLPVLVARALFHLPYFHARMSCTAEGDAIAYASERRPRSGPAMGFEGRYRPTGPVTAAAPGSLEHWLSERYCLYSADRRGRLFRGEIHHAPWPLQAGEAELRSNRACEQIGLAPPAGAPLVHFARRLDVVAWRILPVD